MNDANTQRDDTPDDPVDHEQNVGLVRELCELILHNKKWWLVPILIVLLVIGVLAALGSSALAPFIYPLF